MLLDTIIMGCIATTTDCLEDFEVKVKSALSSIKYKWVIALIVNYHSQTKSAKYVIENFTTIDILSNDIDFYFPGYISDSDMPIIPNSESYRNNLLSEAILQLDILSKGKNVSEEKIKEVEVKLRLLKDFHKNDIENFHGNSKKTKISNKRLGNIWFSEESFADFVADLMKKTGNRYRYLGGCDLVMIPFFNNELQYSDCSVFNLECIANKETQLSVDEFLFRVINTLEQYDNKLEIPSIRCESYAIAITRFKGFIEDLKEVLSYTKQIPEFINKIIYESDNLIFRSDMILERIFHKQKLINRAADLLDEIHKNRDYIISQIVVKEKLESLYKEAIKNIHHPSEKDIVSKIISDIECHVNWKLTEDFYFISYSTKDKTKAEIIRRKLQETWSKGLDSARWNTPRKRLLNDNTNDT